MKQLKSKSVPVPADGPGTSLLVCVWNPVLIVAPLYSLLSFANLDLPTATQGVWGCAHWRALCQWHSLLFCDNLPLELRLCLVAIISCLVTLIFWHYIFLWFKWHFLEMCIPAGYATAIFSVSNNLCTPSIQRSQRLLLLGGAPLFVPCFRTNTESPSWMPDIFTCLFPSTYYFIFVSLAKYFWCKSSKFGEKEKRMLSTRDSGDPVTGGAATFPGSGDIMLLVKTLPKNLTSVKLIYS